MSKDPLNTTNLFSDIDSTDEAKSFFLEAVAKFCERCGEPYTLDAINIVKRTQGQVLLQVRCATCGASHIVSFIQPLGISSKTPFNTDLGLEELKSFSEMDAIASDEVLDLYEYFDTQKDMSASKFLKQLEIKDAGIQDMSPKKD